MTEHIDRIKALLLDCKAADAETDYGLRYDKNADVVQSALSLLQDLLDEEGEGISILDERLSPMGITETDREVMDEDVLAAIASATPEAWNAFKAWDAEFGSANPDYDWFTVEAVESYFRKQLDS